MTRKILGLRDFREEPARYVVLPLIVEFCSQFIFTFWGVMAEEPQRIPERQANSTAQEPVEKDYMTYTFVPAFQTGLAAFAIITLFSKMRTDPAQFNPAITLIFVVVGTISPLMLIPNILVQCLSATFAAYMSQIIRGAPPAALIIPDEASSWSILATEVILVASFTIFAAELTQNPKNDDPMGAFALGVGVFASILSGRWTGVICLNPARAFGVTILTGGSAWSRHWLLWIADSLGALSAGVFWLLFLAPPQRSWLGRFSKPDKNLTKKDVLMKDMDET